MRVWTETGPDGDGRVVGILLGDGTGLRWTEGRFDSWKVMEVGPEVMTIGASPRDADYFGELLGLTEFKDGVEVYRDFLRLYDETGRDLESRCVALIKSLARGYPEDVRGRVERLFSILYMAMISEFHYELDGNRPSILDKRLKGLAVYQVLIDGATPEFAARFSRKGERGTLFRWIGERYGPVAVRKLEPLSHNEVLMWVYEHLVVVGRKRLGL